MVYFSEALPKNAKIFVAAVTAIGFVLLGYSAAVALIWTNLSWLFIGCLTLVASTFPVRLPFGRGKLQSLTITVSDVFVFTAILLYSPEVAVMLSVADGFLASIRLVKRRRLYRVFFNLAQLAVVTFVVGKLFYKLMGQFPPLAISEIGDGGMVGLFVNIGLVGLIYFFLNSASVALVLSMVSGQHFFEVWRQNFLWAGVTTVAGASTAAVIFINFDRTMFALAIAVPIVLVIYYAYKMHLDKVRQANDHVDQIENLYHSTITSLAMAIDAKDQSTHGHVERVKALALALARLSGVTDEAVLKGLRAAALLHDIGKLAIPEYILNKPGQLTDAEKEKIRTHPGIGADILETVPFPYPVVPYVRYHHERWDGGGYPDGLEKEQIPLGARILSVADSYVALRSDRPYRPRFTKELALGKMIQESGKSYDPKLVQVLVNYCDQLEAELGEIRDAMPQTIRKKIESVGSPERIQRQLEKTVFHDIASTHKEMQAIFEISQNIGKSLSVAETMSHLAVRIKRFVPYSSCVIYLVNLEDDHVLPYHVAGLFKNILTGMEVKLGEGVTGWVAANNKPLVDVTPAPDFPNVEMLQAGFKSCLAVPLSVEGNVVGVITLYSDSRNTYGQDHLRLMETIAAHAAGAINNAIIHEQTKESAYTDALTGLPNLRYFNTFIYEELKRASRVGYPVTLLMMDLERFKEVNDRYGHKRGDRILLEVGHRLSRQLRKSDICLRYGGDEFVGILPGVDKIMARHTIERIQEAFDETPVLTEEHDQVNLGVSIGAATFPDDGTDPEMLIAIADREMYNDKMDRKDRREAAASGSIFPLGKQV